VPGIAVYFLSPSFKRLPSFRGLLLLVWSSLLGRLSRPSSRPRFCCPIGKASLLYRPGYCAKHPLEWCQLALPAFSHQVQGL
jgi:hypothetical protein